MRKPKTINLAELNWLFYNGFVIQSVWIGPVEGYEYRLHLLGHQDVVAYRKSERACYNAAVRLVLKQA